MSSSMFYFTGGKMKQKELYKTAIYCRLSLDDGSEGDSSSIHTQKMLLEKYCKDNGYEIYDYYIDAIEFLQIKHLSERPENTWQQGLSPGERQRIALARIFICRPKYVLLDEATSAIPHSLEEKVFQKILSLGITMITISHNYRLKKYHKNILEVYGNRNYSFQKIQTNLN